jgi:hypothetical protein
MTNVRVQSRSRTPLRRILGALLAVSLSAVSMVTDAVRHIAAPGNEQNLDRLSALLALNR